MPRERADRHSTDETVLDASRGLLAVAGNTRVRAHFSFCAPCRHTVGLWKRLSVVTRRLREAEPPEEAVGKAKALAPVSSG